MKEYTEEDLAVQELINRVASPKVQQILRDQIVKDFGKDAYYRTVSMRCTMIGGYMAAATKSFEKREREDKPTFQSFRRVFHASIKDECYDRRLFEMAMTELAIDTLK